MGTKKFDQFVNENMSDNEIYDKAMKLYPKLAKIMDGERSYFWIDKRRDELQFGISLGKDGCECPLAKLSDFVKNDFVPEDITPGMLIDKYLL